MILLASVLGKGVACWAAARMNGEDNPTSLAVGTLMNARGLMELIIINIGLQRGIIGEALFSILVIMAIVTTLDGDADLRVGLWPQRAEIRRAERRWLRWLETLLFQPPLFPSWLRAFV